MDLTKSQNINPPSHLPPIYANDKLKPLAKEIYYLLQGLTYNEYCTVIDTVNGMAKDSFVLNHQIGK